MSASDPHAPLTGAKTLDIDDHGDVVGYGKLSDGTSRAMLFTDADGGVAGISLPLGSMSPDLRLTCHETFDLITALFQPRPSDGDVANVWFSRSMSY